MYYALKTVCPKGTGVRIPLPAPKNKDTPCGCPLFFATVRGSRTPLCESCARRMGFAYPTRRSKSSLFRRRVWVSSAETNTPLPSYRYYSFLTILKSTGTINLSAKAFGKTNFFSSSMSGKYTSIYFRSVMKVIIPLPNFV